MSSFVSKSRNSSNKHHGTFSYTSNRLSLYVCLQTHVTSTRYSPSEMGKTAVTVAKEIEWLFKFQRNISSHAPFKSPMFSTSSGKFLTPSIRSRSRSSTSSFGFDCSKSFFHDRVVLIGLFQFRASVSEIKTFNLSLYRLASTHLKKTHYEVLNISRSASSEEIRQAFITLSKTWHPDKNPQDPTRHQKFVQINEAYSTLSKPLSRRDYDLSLDAQRYVSRQMSASTSRTYGYGYSANAGPYYHYREHVYDEYYWASEAHGTQRARFTSLMNFYMLIICATFATVSIILHYMYNYIPNPKLHHLRKDLSPEEVEKHDFIMQSEQDGVTVYYYAVPKKSSKKVDIVVLRKSQDSSSEEPKMHEVTRSSK